MEDQVRYQVFGGKVYVDIDDLSKGLRNYATVEGQPEYVQEMLGLIANNYDEFQLKVFASDPSKIPWNELERISNG